MVRRRNGSIHFRLGVAQFPVKTNVVGGIVVYQGRSSFNSLGGIGHAGQYLVVDFDEVGCVAGGGQVFGDDHCDPVTHVFDPIGHQEGVGRLLHGGAVFEVDLPASGNPVDASGSNVFARKDRNYPRVSQGRVNIDAFDDGVGIRAAHDMGMGHANEFDVVGVFAFARGKALVFNALYGLTDVCHSTAALVSFNFLAAHWIERTMLWYPVQRQKLPSSACRISVSEGSGLFCNKSAAAMIMPGVQNPHCKPCSSLKPS